MIVKMPLYNKADPYRSMLKELENEKEFDFKISHILEPEIRDVLIRIIRKNSSHLTKGQLTKEDIKREMERLANGVISKVRLGQGKIKTLIYSKGGSYTAEEEEMKKTINESKSNVEYIVIYINGIVIIEPLGQLNNATYIAKQEEDLEENLRKYGRKSAIRNGVIFKIIHETNEEYEGYNYSSNHIIQILDYCIKNPEQLLRVAKEFNGCGLRKISQNMQKIIDEKALKEGKDMER